jgi:hypothetical protein
VDTLNLRVTRRGVQITLGLIWLLDGALQFQSYFYSQAFLSQMIEPVAPGQPAPISHSITWAAHFASHHLTLYNTLFAITQVLIGLGLLFPPTVRPALLLSFGWAIVVWWFGEGFGMIPMGMASPLTGAPGAVLLYALIGLLVWPTRRPDRRSAADGGPVGELGGLAFWSILWLVSADLWVQRPVNRTADATASTIAGTEASSMHWLASLEASVARTTSGHGLAIAVVFAAISVVVALGVFTPLRAAALWLGIAVSLVYWLLGQSLGGLTTTQSTDLNAGPLFVLLALALMPRRAARSAPAASSPSTGPGLPGTLAPDV